MSVFIFYVHDLNIMLIFGKIHIFTYSKYSNPYRNCLHLRCLGLSTAAESGVRCCRGGTGKDGQPPLAGSSDSNGASQ